MTNARVPPGQQDEFDEVERYELRERRQYGFRTDRRGFGELLGAGLIVVIGTRRTEGQRRGRTGGESARLSQRFHLGVDGTVTVLSGKVEVGQGARTQITQAAAEELGLPVERIQVILADTEVCPDDGGTAGSRTTPSTIPQVRQAAAALRQVLIQMAAKKLDVDQQALTLDESGVVHRESNRRVTLGELAQLDDVSAAMEAVSRDVELMQVDQWQVLGTGVNKPSAQEIVTGAWKFPSDISLPGMLFGKILRPPALAATLESLDTSVASAMDGVVVVEDGSFVGCVAATSWRAAKAIEGLAKTATWKRGEHPSSDELFSHLKATAETDDRESERTRSKDRGDEPGDAKKSIRESYTVAYIQHAPMEPRAAVAHWEDGKLTVWTGTQQPMRVRGELMSVFRLSEDRVRVIVPDTGGGFGGKHSGEVAVEAARLAKACGKPVSLRWTRQEEFYWAYCRPAGLIEVAAAVDDGGQIQSWDFINYNSGRSAIETPYRIERATARFVSTDSPLRQGSYRALASTANTFARESTMDELAAVAGIDPLEFRLRHLPDGRLRDVLVEAATKFRWRERYRPVAADGVGFGLACGTEKGSYVAACVEAEVRQGRIIVRAICQAFECGAIQNPANLRSQVEGCIVMGLGGALMEEMRFRDGVVLTDRFSEYQVPRLKDTPEMDIVLCNRPDLASVGAGETPIIAVTPAIANAVFHATGRRIRSMPLRVT